MKKYQIVIISIIAVALTGLAAINNIAQDSKQRMYVGTKKCKMCHMSGKKGAQYKVWKKSPHAKAYETLGTPEAKEIAAKAGVTDPQKDGKCLKCHVTAYGVDAKYLDKKYNMEDGVSCESCHGAGGDYASKKVMADLSMGKIKGETVGLIMPDEALCKTCHNEESPTYKDFNFAERVKKIAHPMPAEYKKSKGYPD